MQAADRKSQAASLASPQTVREAQTLRLNQQSGYVDVTSDSNLEQMTQT